MRPTLNDLNKLVRKYEDSKPFGIRVLGDHGSIAVLKSYIKNLEELRKPANAHLTNEELVKLLELLNKVLEANQDKASRKVFINLLVFLTNSDQIERVFQTSGDKIRRKEIVDSYSEILTLLKQGNFFSQDTLIWVAQCPLEKLRFLKKVLNKLVEHNALDKAYLPLFIDRPPVDPEEIREAQAYLTIDPNLVYPSSRNESDERYDAKFQNQILIELSNLVNPQGFMRIRCSRLDQITKAYLRSGNRLTYTNSTRARDRDIDGLFKFLLHENYLTPQSLSTILYATVDTYQTGDRVGHQIDINLIFKIDKITKNEYIPEVFLRANFNAIVEIAQQLKLSDLEYHKLETFFDVTQKYIHILIEYKDFNLYHYLHRLYQLNIDFRNGFYQIFNDAMVNLIVDIIKEHKQRNAAGIANNQRTHTLSNLESIIYLFAFLKSIDLLTPENITRIKEHPHPNRLEKICSVHFFRPNQTFFETILQYQEIIYQEYTAYVPPYIQRADDLALVLQICQDSQGNLQLARQRVRNFSHGVFEVAEGIARAPQGINYGQSTHNVEVHKSVSESAARLREKYGAQIATPELLDGVINEIIVFISNLPDNDPLALLTSDYSSKYDVQLLSPSENNARQANILYIDCRPDELIYEVIGPNGNLRKGNIKRSDLPGDFPLEAKRIIKHKTTWLHYILNITTQQGATKPSRMLLQHVPLESKIAAAKRAVLRDGCLEVDFTDPRSKVTRKEMFALYWIAAHDKNLRNPATTEQEAENLFIDALYQIQREYGFKNDPEGSEDYYERGGPDHQSCISGAYNKPAEAYKTVLPKLVDVRVSSQKAAQLRLPIVVKDCARAYLRQMQAEKNQGEFVAYINEIQNPDNGVEYIWDEISANIKEEMLEFSPAYASQQELDDFIDAQGKYVDIDDVLKDIALNEEVVVGKGKEPAESELTPEAENFNLEQEEIDIPTTPSPYSSQNELLKSLHLESKRRKEQLPEDKKASDSKATAEQTPTPSAEAPPHTEVTETVQTQAAPAATKSVQISELLASFKALEQNQRNLQNILANRQKARAKERTHATLFKHSQSKTIHSNAAEMNNQNEADPLRKLMFNLQNISQFTDKNDLSNSLIGREIEKCVDQLSKYESLTTENQETIAKNMRETANNVVECLPITIQKWFSNALRIITNTALTGIEPVKLPNGELNYKYLIEEAENPDLKQLLSSLATLSPLIKSIQQTDLDELLDHLNQTDDKGTTVFQKTTDLISEIAKSPLFNKLNAYKLDQINEKLHKYWDARHSFAINSREVTTQLFQLITHLFTAAPEVSSSPSTSQPSGSIK